MGGGSERNVMDRHYVLKKFGMGEGEKSRAVQRSRYIAMMWIFTIKS